jgi:signal transduction histidine kinase/predicted RNA-binding protein with RPS1 domain/DNA-binding NarL/FixJ family response regulator
MSELVEVEVVETSRTGAKVRILDEPYVNRVGFIRRQELSWDQRVDADPPWPEVGDHISAKVLGSRDARLVRLSLRLGDPWQNEQVEERFQTGQVVQGQIVQISRYGAFVQLVPGVDARARIGAIPLQPDESLEDVLAVGDEIQVVITRIDPIRKQIEISLTERLRQLSLLPSRERRFFQIDLFKDIPSSEERLPGTPVDGAPSELQAEREVETPNSLPAVLKRVLGRESGRQPPGEEDEMVPAQGLIVPETEIPEPRFRRQCPSLEKLEKVLIVEDDEADRREIGKRIEAAFQVQVAYAQSGEKALEKANGGIEYDLVLIDVNLQDENAIEIAEGLETVRSHCVVVFMSHDPMADEKLPGNCAFVLKDQGFASVVQCIEEIIQGDGQQIDEEEGEPDAQRGDFVHHLGMEAFTRRSLEETLQPMLHRLRLQTRVSQAVVFQADSVEKEVSVVAADPILDENAQRYLLDRLYYSPVQNVVEDEEPYYETNTMVRRRHPRFKRLYQVLPFRSCLGLPLTIPDLETRHALFLFDENRPRLELEDLDNARLAARFLQVALERAAFFEFMQRYEARYSRGLLIGSLMHELAIKLNTLDSLVETLPTILRKATNPPKPSERSKWLQEAQEIAEELRENRQGLGDLVDAYLQMAKENWEAVDVNAVVEKVRLQMKKLAEETEVAIYLEAGDIPPARAIASRLEQILLNLVLNAIQQIGRQRAAMARLPRRKGDDLVLLQKGQVIIQTRFAEADPACPIQVLVIDTGPGIRYPDQKRIFRLDTTTREEGYGWGLFISRNLIEIMRGRLRLVDSLRFIGSAFAVELPSFSASGGA